MAHEYRRKTAQGSRSDVPPSFSHRKRSQSDSSKGDPKRPKISEEKQKAFEKNMRHQAAQEKQKKLGEIMKAAKRQKMHYEQECSKLFSPDGKTFLTYRDIPWPFVSVDNKIRPLSLTDQKRDDSLRNSVEEFLFSDLPKDSADFRKYLKTQQVRWHPDRFQQKCGNRLDGKDRDRIVGKVKEVSQILNALAEG